MIEDFTSRRRDIDVIENHNGQKTVQKYDRMLVQGKKIKGKDETIYLTRDDVHCIKLISEYRVKANVPNDNNFLFGLPSGKDGRLRHANAFVIMLKFINKCHADYKPFSNPTAMTSTSLKKPLATNVYSKIGEGGMTVLCCHMAHTDRINREVYQNKSMTDDAIIINLLRNVNKDASIKSGVMHLTENDNGKCFEDSQQVSNDFDERIEIEDILENAADAVEGAARVLPIAANVI